MKKILALLALGGGAFFFIRRNRAAKLESDLWREATTPPAE